MPVYFKRNRCEAALEFCAVGGYATAGCSRFSVTAVKRRISRPVPGRASRPGARETCPQVVRSLVLKESWVASQSLARLIPVLPGVVGIGLASHNISWLTPALETGELSG